METKIERIQRIEKEVKDLKEILEKEKAEEEIEKPKTVRDLEERDKYFFINEIGKIDTCHWEGDKIDEKILENGNAFLTEKEAEAERDYRQSKVIISNWIDDNNARPVEGEDRYYIYILIDGELKKGIIFSHSYIGGIYVNSEENFKKIIKEIPEHLTRILTHRI